MKANDMSLEFLKSHSRSFVLNTIDEVICQQMGRYNHWSVKFTPKDFMCLMRNVPVKNIQYSMFSKFKDMEV